MIINVTKIVFFKLNFFQYEEDNKYTVYIHFSNNLESFSFNTEEERRLFIKAILDCKSTFIDLSEFNYSDR